ncbi:MAG: T9SS type A sorting domain-containing protein [Bacteroidota bacterium]
MQWTTNGIVISTAVNGQQNPTIVSDGSGGAIISWDDLRSGNVDIYAQKINASGIAQWTDNGVAISTAVNNQVGPKIIDNGSGGAIIAWKDYRSGSNYDIYAQNISASGVVRWVPNGNAISTAANDQQQLAIISDGSEGAIITWSDYRSGTDLDIYAQKVNVSGTVQWTYNGVAILAAGSQTYPTIISDGFGGAIISWEDYRNVRANIYAQKINTSGVVQWIANGVAISNPENSNTDQKIITDGFGGAIISWRQFRNGTNYDIYAQKINAAGIVQWSTNGVAASNANNSKQQASIASDGVGGAILSWTDLRSVTHYETYAQRLDRFGNLYPAPWIDKVGDIANDQGGKLRLLWSASSLDIWENSSIKSYTIKVGAKATGLLGKTENAAGNGIYWQTVGSIPADRSEGYTTVVSTYADSGLQGRPYYYFQVIAKNADSTILWTSNIDSGYSVDNIPPVGTGGGVIASNMSGAIMLKWNKNKVDPDLMGYVVFKGSVPGFTPNTQSRISLTTDTLFVDTTSAIGSMNYYRIAGIDKHGNVGTPTPELSQRALAVELTSFTASVSGRSVVLRWNTATETENHGFGVERKYANGKVTEWTELGFIEGAGTSAAPHAYSFTDGSPRSGEVQYRLRQTDHNGAIHYSNSIEVKITAPSEFVLYQNYPNPFNPSTNIDFTVPVNGHTELKIYSTLGTEVSTLFTGDASSGEYHHVVFDARNLSSGIYIARLTYGGQTLSKKITLLK